MVPGPLGAFDVLCNLKLQSHFKRPELEHVFIAKSNFQ